MLVDLYKAGEMPNIILGGTGGLGTSTASPRASTSSTLDGPWMFPIFAGQYPDLKLAGTRRSRPVRAERQRRRRRGHRDDEVVEEQGRGGGVHTFMLSRWAQNQMATRRTDDGSEDLTKQLVKIHPYYSVYLKQIATARPRTPTPKWPQIDQVLADRDPEGVQGR